MNDELLELYQELILDHNARPHNFGTMQGSTHHAHGLNPLCGDYIEVFLQLDGNQIKDAKFSGHGCAISKASASLMTDAVKEASKEQAQAMFDVFHRLVTGENVSEVERENLGKVAAFSGVKEFPARVKCASLAWHTLKAALNQAHESASREPVSTE
jgi:nitrogen fixation protein NifU and related proteins